MGAAFQHRGVSSSRVQLTGAETHEKGGWHGGICQAGGSSDHYSGSAGCSPRVLHVGYLLSLLAAADPSRAVQLPAAGTFSRLPPASSITRLVPPLLVPFPTTLCGYKATGLCSKQGLARVCRSSRLQGDLCILPAGFLDFILVIVVCVGCSLWSPQPLPGLGELLCSVMDPRIQRSSPRAAIMLLKSNSNSMSPRIPFVQPPLPNCLGTVGLWLSPGEDGEGEEKRLKEKKEIYKQSAASTEKQMGDTGREKKTMDTSHVLVGSGGFLIELFRACLVCRSLLMIWSWLGRCMQREGWENICICPHRSLTAPANLLLVISLVNATDMSP